MKKLIIISAALLIAVVSESKGQHFIASYGSEQHWDMPAHVTHVVYDRYYNYDWVHASRVYNPGGFYSYNVLLQRGGSFVEVNIDNHGYTRVVNRYNYYPLGGHVCDPYCGYHQYYYNTYYNICHSHNHFGHNHVYYRPRPVTYVYGHYRTYPQYRPTTVIVNNPPVKHYKQSKKQYHKPQYSRQEPQRRESVNYEQRSSYATRRTSTQGVTVKNNDDDRRRTSSSSYERESDSSRESGRTSSSQRSGSTQSRRGSN